jgi:hypothetical protein
VATAARGRSANYSAHYSAHHDVTTVQAIALGQGVVLDGTAAAAVAAAAGATLDTFRRLAAGLTADDDPGALRSLLEREAGR